MAVDAFRGFVVCLGIFVNYGGGGYWYFNYSRWNGLTFADLVFPWLLFVMGLSTTLSLHAQRKMLAKRSQMTGKVILRCVRLFALGLFLNNGRDLGNWRVTGVLQVK
jgi:heparan-alpha-glucosaminide N-acetyltransferase